MSRGLRRIVVDGRPLRWRFDDVLVVLPADRSGPQLVVGWGWREHTEMEGPGEEPQTVTPAFVAAAVRAGLANGWDPAVNGPPTRLGFAGGRFTT